MEAIIPSVALIDAARRPTQAWDDIGESRVSWMVRIAALPVLGAWRYAVQVKPRLEAAAAAASLRGA